MIFSKQLIWFGLRGCLYCGCLIRESDGLCDVCNEDLWSWRPAPGLFQQKIHKLPVETLFQWIPGKQEVLSRLLRKLKGTGGEELWRPYAEEFLRQRLPDHLPKKFKPVLLIPAPARSEKKDHAYIFAEHLAREGAGIELYNCLSRDGAAGSQKKRSRSQRQKVELHWTEKITQRDFNLKSQGKHIVFVDDVVTTGSTAMAAWRALGKPRDFAVWALAQRRLSCGASKDLL